MRTLIALLTTVGLYLVLFTTSAAKIPAVVYKDKPVKTFAQLVREVPPKYGIAPEVVAVLLAKESGGSMSAIRFEPHHLKRVARITKNPDQQRLWASSLCAFQIMGWHMEGIGHPTDLFDPEVCVEMGSRIFAKCLERHKNKDKYTQLAKAFECYNGDAAYSRDAMRRLGAILINRM